MIYTSMKLYNPQDVNYYVLDFGAEVFEETDDYLLYRIAEYGLRRLCGCTRFD